LLNLCHRRHGVCALADPISRDFQAYSW
jgi:hypothetical protein